MISDPSWIITIIDQEIKMVERMLMALRDDVRHIQSHLVDLDAIMIARVTDDVPAETKSTDDCPSPRWAKTPNDLG